MTKRAENEGFRMLDDFVFEANSDLELSNGGTPFPPSVTHEDTSLGGPDVSALDTLKMVFGQYEQKIHRLVSKLQSIIDELKKQNNELKASLMGKDLVVNRYYLDGPNEDEI